MAKEIIRNIGEFSIVSFLLRSKTGNAQSPSVTGFVGERSTIGVPLVVDYTAALGGGATGDVTWANPGGGSSGTSLVVVSPVMIIGDDPSTWTAPGDIALIKMIATSYSRIELDFNEDEVEVEVHGY